MSKFTTKLGDIFTSDATVICHQVNCMGVMGSGVAKGIKTNFPEAYEDYKKSVNVLNKECLGGCILSKRNDNKGWIGHLFGQYYYNGYFKSFDDYLGTPEFKLPEFDSSCKAIRFTNYEALYRSLTVLKNHLEGMFEPEELSKIKLAFPVGLGCGRGGGDWNIVSSILHFIFLTTPYEIEMWKL